MLTELGKVMRIIRINTGDSMRTMASKIGLSAAYLSAIENGKRNVPENMEELLSKHYELSDTDRVKIKEAIEQSSSKVKINLTEMTEKKKKLIFTIKDTDLDDDTLNQLCEIINKKGSDGK